MADMKVSWFFESMQMNTGFTGSSHVGWSETWYANFTGLDSGLAFAIRTDKESWLSRRLAFMHALYSCKWCRISEVANPRKSKIAPVPDSPFGAIGRAATGGGRINVSTPADAVGAAQVTCCVLIDIYALPNIEGEKVHRRSVLLRGLPRSMIYGNILNEAGEGFTALSAFADFIGRGQSPNVAFISPAPFWQMAIQDPTQRYQQITALTVDPVNPRQIILTAPLPAAGPDRKINVRNVTGLQGVNRTWTVKRTAPIGGPYTLGKSRQPILGTWGNNGEANLVTLVLRSANQYVIRGLRVRQTGLTPFDRTRGSRRRSAV